MKTFIICLFMASLFLSSCHKDPPVQVEDPPGWVPDSCDISIPGHISIWGVNFELQFPSYQTPCFNPNNGNEIIFIESWNKDSITIDTTFNLRRGGIVKYNLETQEKFLVYDGSLQIRPRWSRKDWIIFYTSDHLIYKIKSNGDSLTQLTFEGMCRGPEWNKAGDMFVYALGPSNISVFCDENGNELFRKEGGSLSLSWQHDSLMVNAFAGVVTWNPSADTIIYNSIHPIADSHGYGVEWMDDEHIIWSNFDGIHVTNRIDSTFVRIKESCIGDFFITPTFSTQAQKAIFVRRDRTITDVENAIGTLTRSLWIINPDGTEFDKIEVPEW